MADATHSPTTYRVPLHQNPETHHQATYPLPSPTASIPAQRERASRPLQGEPCAALAALTAKRQQWARLNLRQQWADEAFMRGHLRMAGLRVKVNAEPATVPRMKSLLRTIGVHSPEVQEAVGMPLWQWLERNPRMPLWAALALVLEGTGRFTPDMGATL